MSDYLPTKFEVGGKAYSINLTDWDAEQLIGLGFDVYSWHEAFQEEPSETALKTLSLLYDHGPEFTHLIIACCHPDDETEFRKGFDAEAKDKAREAMQNAIVNFTPPQSRSSGLKLLQAAQKAATQMDTVTAEELTNLSEKLDFAAPDTVTAES